MLVLTRSALSAFGPAKSCGGDHGFRLDTGSNTGWTANGAGFAWRFTAPAGTVLVTANATVHYGNDGGFAAASFSDGAPPFTVFGTCQTPSSCWTSAGANSATVFEVRLQCFKSPNCHSNWAYAWTTGFTATVRDLLAPGIAVSGPLLSGSVVRGVQGLQSLVTDNGGGGRGTTIYVNGIKSRSVDFCPPDHGSEYTALRPCPPSWLQQLAIDTQKDPGWTNGPNDVEMCSTDVGGNVSSPCVRRTVNVDNSCPSSGGTAAAELDAGADVGGQLKGRALVTSNIEPVIRGSLRDGASNAVAGATVCVYETVNLPDSSRELVGTRDDSGQWPVRDQTRRGSLPSPGSRLSLQRQGSWREGPARLAGGSDSQRSPERISRMARPPCSKDRSRVPTPTAVQ